MGKHTPTVIAVSGQGGFSTKNLSVVRKEMFGLSETFLADGN